MIKKYCKSYLLLIVVFLAVSIAADGNLFFVFYPCVVSGMIPVTLLGYDEHSKWNEYCRTLPYSMAQIVSVKYLIGAFTQIIVLILSAIAQAVRMTSNGTFDPAYYISLMSVLFILSCIASSIGLPFMFRFGVEKGRIAYAVMIGFACAGSAVASITFNNSLHSQISFNITLPLLCVIAAAVYAASWYLSIISYKKHEIR